MTESQIKALIEQGNLVKMPEDEYKATGRKMLQDVASQFIDMDQGVLAGIALNEVKRLDLAYGYKLIP